jgi:hypothetical protein
MGPEEGLRAASVAEPLEAVISRIPGVRATRVVMDLERIAEVHVVSGPDRKPKQLVRDIQSVAMASLDLEVDYRIISIVQLDDEPRGLDDARVAPRLPLARVVGSTSGQLTTVDVVLNQDDTELVGQVRGSATQLDTLVARATLQAFEPQLGGTVGEVISVGRVDAAAITVVLVLVRLVSSAGERLVSGSAILGADANDAIARATLAAVNRVQA